MGGVADFITSFHNLEGDLIGERKKNLYTLFKRPSLFSNEQELNDALQKLVPETYQESVFYLEALIYFKRTEKLVEILKSGNQLFATKILKQPWFFEQAFKNIEAVVLVNEFLPYFSYVVRKKLLNRISKCWKEEKMDHLFNALEKCYGLTEAVDILHKCSPGKITSVLEENEIKLRPNQVIQLCTKDEVLKIYLKHLKENTKTAYAEQKVINCIALNKPKLLIELEKNEIIIVNNIGRRTTKTIMKASKDEISTDIKRYTKFLNKHIIVKKCSPDFKIVYKTVFPDKFNDVNWNTCDLIYYYPKNRRWNLFTTTFLEKFPRKSVTDVLPSFDESIKKIEPPKDVIQQWAKILYEQRPSQYDYLKYYPTSEAIQIIKEKISVTSDKSKRHTLVEVLLETCAENKDLDLLEEVLKYISQRHRNEDFMFRNNLLEKISNLFDLKELKETHWKYIYEQIQILKLQKEFAMYNHTSRKLIMRHLEFLLKNKKDYKPMFGVYMEDLSGEEFYNSFELEDHAIEKEIYCETSKFFPDFVKEDNEKYISSVNNLISKLISFSLKNKEFCIQIKNYPYIVEQIIKCFGKEIQTEYYAKDIIVKTIIYNETFPQYAIDIEDSTILETFSYITKEIDESIWWFNDVLEKVVNKKNRSELGNKLLKMYINIEENKETLAGNVIPWILKNEPKTLVTYLDIVLNNINPHGCFLDTKLVKQYSHLGLDKRVRDYYKKHLEIIDKTEDIIISRLLEGLLDLLPTEEFIKIVEEKYLPKKDKLDLEDEEMRELYKIQTDLTKKLAKVTEPYKMLPTIMKFSRGDFLPISLAALYSSFYKSPQRMLYPYVERLSKQAVSARKHAIFLSCAVLDKEHTINLLKTRNERNVSSQKYLFSATLKYFVKNPSQELLDKVIENMSTIDKNDTETLDSLKSVHIPRKYRHTYIEKCWRFFENLESSGIKVKEYLEKLLDYMCEEILVTLSKEFVYYVLNRYLPVQDNERLLRIDHFAVAVLKNRKTERDENFKLVFGIVSTCKKHFRYEFFRTFINDVHHDDTDTDFIRLFSDNWTKYFTIIQTLPEYIRMKLLLLRVDNSDIEKYAVTVVDYLDQLISDLSYLVLSTFKEELVDTLQPLELKDKLYFYRAVLKHKQNAITCVLIIQIIDNVNENDDDENEDIKQVYKDIKTILQTVNEPIVIAYYKSQLADNN